MFVSFVWLSCTAGAVQTRRTDHRLILSWPPVQALPYFKIKAAQTAVLSKRCSVQHGRTVLDELLLSRSSAK